MLTRIWKIAGSKCLCLLALVLSSCAATSPPSRDFSAYVLAAVRSMPSGGGYASDRAAEVRLAERGIVRAAQGLRVDPAAAAPTFCSAACYMALVKALQSWEGSLPAPVFTPAVWESLRVEPRHPDGYLAWGRANANGPGFAKWVHDTGAGVNFSSLAAARPGDFLKFFHNTEIGVRERGHMVIFLGAEQRDGELCIRYWSSNKPGGYGVRSAPVRSMHHLIFTRITHPARLAASLRLPQLDSWLASMIERDFSYAECAAKIRLDK